MDPSHAALMMNGSDGPDGTHYAENEIADGDEDVQEDEPLEHSVATISAGIAAAIAQVQADRMYDGQAHLPAGTGPRENDSDDSPERGHDPDTAFEDGRARRGVDDDADSGG
jgi:hypothetical protein